MKVVHVINSMSSKHGGPSFTTLLTVKGLIRLGADARILTKQMLPGEVPLSDEPFICYLPVSRFYNERWGYLRSLPKALQAMSDADVFHIQELWQYPGYATARSARKRSIPYVVTLHGGMYPGAMEYSSLVKRVALQLFERRLLQEAACIHVTCTEEMEYYRALGFTNPVAVIPNPLEACEVEKTFCPDKPGKVGYLGRLHPCKRVERLLEVWSRLREPGELLIMGDGEPDYVSFLQQEAERLELSSVRFSGWVSGVEKNRLLASLACLVVPSDFENFGMIVAEALLQEVPVIATTGSPWQELETERCGWWVDNDMDTLTEAVRKALELDKDLLHEMGKRGRQLILRKYTMDAVSLQLVQMYDWITGKINTPGFISELNQE